MHHLYVHLYRNQIIDLDSSFYTYAFQEAGNNAANLCTGYSPILTFEIESMDHTIMQALSLGALLDGSMKYVALGKVMESSYSASVIINEGWGGVGYSVSA